MGTGASKSEAPVHYDSDNSADSDIMIPTGIENWNETHDRILSLLLTAAEFLRRKIEAEKGIMILSGMTVEEREEYLDSVEGLMGLRGHLLDELIRIQEMLAEDDPDLYHLEPFREKFPRVVRNIVEMKNRARNIGTIDVSEIELEKDHIIFGFSSEEEDDIVEDSVAPNEQGPSTTKIPNKVSIRPLTAKKAEAEDKLSKKHNSEDMEMAKNYAEKVVMRAGTITKAEIDKLLEEHAVQVQALKKKQAMEKKKLKSMLDGKTTGAGSSLALNLEGDESENEDDWGKTKAKLQHELWATLQSSPGITLDDLREVLNALKPVSSGFMTDRLDDEDSDSSAYSDAEVEPTNQVDRKVELTPVREEGTQASESEGTDDNVRKMDEEFLAQMRSQAHLLINDEYALFLKQHLEEMEKKTASTSSSCMTDDSGQTDKENEALKEELLEKIKHKEKLSPKELEEILKNFRQEQLNIAKGHRNQREVAQEKLKLKLEERRRKKKIAMQEEKRQTKQVDDSFIENLRSLYTSGKVSEEVFTSMVTTYMSQITALKKSKKQKKKEKKERKEKEALELICRKAEQASKFPEEHSEKNKELQELRSGEKAKIDEALAKKLEEKKKEPLT